jgi:hypothetical protein
MLRRLLTTAHLGQPSHQSAVCVGSSSTLSLLSKSVSMVKNNASMRVGYKAEHLAPGKKSRALNQTVLPTHRAQAHLSMTYAMYIELQLVSSASLPRSVAWGGPHA